MKTPSQSPENSFINTNIEGYMKLDEEERFKARKRSDSEAIRGFYNENFRYTRWRWLVLFVVGFSCFAGYY